MIYDYEKIIEEFRNKISINIYNQVIYTDNKLKLNALRNHLKNDIYIATINKIIAIMQQKAKNILSSCLILSLEFAKKLL